MIFPLTVGLRTNSKGEPLGIGLPTRTEWFHTQFPTEESSKDKILINVFLLSFGFIFTAYPPPTVRIGSVCRDEAHPGRKRPNECKGMTEAPPDG